MCMKIPPLFAKWSLWLHMTITGMSRKSHVIMSKGRQHWQQRPLRSAEWNQVDTIGFNFHTESINYNYNLYQTQILQTLFVHDIHLDFPLGLKFGTEHCAICFWANTMCVMKCMHFRCFCIASSKTSILRITKQNMITSMMVKASLQLLPQR